MNIKLILKNKYLLKFVFYILFFLLLHPSIADTATFSASNNFTSGKGLSNGLIAYWTFDGKDMTNGRVNDVSGNGNNGNLINIATSTFYAQGKFGQSFNFDGVNDYVTSSTNLNLSGVYSVSVWVYKVPETSRRFIQLGDSSNAIYSQISVNPPNESSIHCIQNTLSGGLSVALSATASNYAWHNVVCNWNGGTLTSMYVDGVQTVTGPANGTWAIPTNTGIKIGARADLTNFFVGKIDDFRLYNRALSVSEINQLYSQGSTKFATSQKVTATSTCSYGLSCGLVGYWTFDGKDMTNGRVNDKSGNNNNGNLINIATSTFYTQGKIGQGFRFDGLDDYINAGTNSSLNITGNTITISAWIYPNSAGVGSRGRIVDNNNATGAGYIFNVDSINVTKGLAFGFNSILNPAYGYTVSDTITLNKWQHVAVVYDNGTANFYVNGIAQSIASAPTGNISSSASQLNIGGRSNNIDRNFDGVIDEVRIYNRALTANEINQLYSQGSTKFATSQKVTATSTCSYGLSCGLVSYWTFDGKDMTNGRVNDKSGNNNNGNLINIATSTFYTQGKIGQGFRFDGSDDRISIGSDIINTSATTICSWVNPTVNSLTRFIFTTRSAGGSNILGLYLSNLNNNSIYFFSNTSATFAVSANGSFVLNKWQHICATRDISGLANIYVNGILSGSANQNSGTPTSAVSTHIGTIDSSLGLGGYIDDVRVYNRALSAGEVNQIYSQGR